ncbi:hypothetical protein BKA67DRAFT_206207 [Truncatella angustata]|uniref:Uncharacterized protein n=1 Tax=Truncatella angustata TaxID=152316 RepID=A0A9P8UU79_9PEZI|nr:uncharacterized protein BKA67DRAFT_206207 [Truncatella angustata]KAH6658095.1 hypothetical protein BKA67DRAFT_206207 [Truncatella angustata]
MKTDTSTATKTTLPPPLVTSTDSPSPTTTSFPPLAVTSTDSPSPTTTTFPPKITSSAVPFLNHPQLSSSSTLAFPTVPNTFVTISSALQPVQAKPSPTNIALAPAISDTTTPTTSRSPIITNGLSTTSTAARQLETSVTETISTSVVPVADSVTMPTDGLGPEQYRDNGKVHLDAGSVAGIAVGSSIGTMVIAAMLFIIWRKWGKGGPSKRSSDEDSPSSGSAAGGVRQYLPRRFTHKSDDRIMNELIQGAYSVENGARNSYLDQMPANSSGYLEEKRRSLEDDEVPILPAEPEQVAQPGFKRTKRISRWLGRQDSEMMNPMMARASLVSNATGLRTLDLRSMSGWGSDDGYSEYTRFTLPPTQLQPAPRRVDETPEDVVLPEPLDIKKAEQPDAQGVDVRIRDSTPIAQFPSPEELKLPPAIGRPPSVTARTEVTGRSSGSWNTWGVMQHREKPKGWKEKMGM